MKRLALIITAALMVSIPAAAGTPSDFHKFSVTTIDGKEFDLSTLKGKKVMIVNTASRCGLTPQYEALEELFKTYGESGDFVIIGFPANNFANQEPGTDDEIAIFCSENYGVTFPMMSKISVRGDDIHPLYKWLTEKELNGVIDAQVTWNFQKFLVDENGKLADVIPPREKPDSERVINWITGR